MQSTHLLASDLALSMTCPADGASFQSSIQAIRQVKTYTALPDPIPITQLAITSIVVESFPTGKAADLPSRFPSTHLPTAEGPLYSPLPTLLQSQTNSPSAFRTSLANSQCNLLLTHQTATSWFCS